MTRCRQCHREVRKNYDHPRCRELGSNCGGTFDHVSNWAGCPDLLTHADVYEEILS